MKYLVDSLQRYESDYGNVLCLVQNEPDQSFMGDSTLLQPVTVHEFCMFGTTIMSALNKPPTTCSQLNTLSVLNPITSMCTPNTEQPEQTMTWTSPSSASALATLGAIYSPASSISLANTIPLAGVCIPDLPQSQGGWHIALHQWYDTDPKTGYAL